ncbi:hypothetical protein [Aurantimonas endophytica]|uniref:Uncharacterized protein n=1 Tax=Aurantimonas endophytica TaxID=1522175 RepID=A0A7W6HFT3_9HYPH|nr:hypothetical protein [Aurantimonas endophytica]MBB4004446.1 hypothetical protein [Aurantimonas endophytica]MCO6405283.1 hypothetical protein [Aurantimonas endophytica]
MNDEESILASLATAYEAPKIALPPIDWKVDRQNARYLRVPIVCDCAPVDLLGVSIVGTAWTDEPDERVTFQLIMDVNGTNYRIARIDWRPRQPHTNRVGPAELLGLMAMTSIHDFPENAALGLEAMQAGNLPVVKPIDPEPDSFNALLQYLRDTFQLDNAMDIPAPPWAPQLL